MHSPLWWGRHNTTTPIFSGHVLYSDAVAGLPAQTGAAIDEVAGSDAVLAKDLGQTIPGPRAIYSIVEGSWIWRPDKKDPSQLRGACEVRAVNRDAPLWDEYVGELRRRMTDRNYGWAFRYWPPS